MPKESLAIESTKISRTFLGFLVAPLIPVFLLSLSAGAYFFIILIIGVPIAYVGALVIGTPLLYLLRKLRCVSWHYFVLGGVLCILPYGLFYSGSTSTHMEIHGLRNMVTYCVIGAAGGLIFWFISIRGRHNFPYSTIRNYLGLGGVLLIGLALSYIYYVGSSKSQEGKMLQQSAKFISSSRREVNVQLGEGSLVKAYLPANLPFRSSCPISIISRRSYLDRTEIYWVNGYKDSPFVNVWSILDQNKKDEIPRTCE